MDVIIIGAGAAGLMAAKKLSEGGLKVCVLEARSRIGGRIYSSYNDSLEVEEGGAEFIHGHLQTTFDLLKEANVAIQEIFGDVWNIKDGKWKQENDFFNNYDLVIKKLRGLKEDISIATFANKYFHEVKYHNLRKSLTAYVEGYYSGEIERTSAKAFLEECLSEDEQQYKPEGGYGKMLDFLQQKITAAGSVITLSTAVKQISWSKGNVVVTDTAGREYTAAKVVVTVPLGVWSAPANAEGAIQYKPALPAKTAAVSQMGFGSVIKILLYFKNVFWEGENLEKLTKRQGIKLHMAISDQPVPTWWTQLNNRSHLLTGWLSGPSAEKIKDQRDDAILLMALDSLSSIFNIPSADLKKNLASSKIFNWTNDPFTLGSYSYSTLQTEKARKVLLEPTEETLFFAGEALYDGPEMGTVEAALTSGINAASQILMA